MKKVFDTHGNDNDLNSRSGQIVEIVRQLASDECDIDEVGKMYRVRFDDGYEADVFEDELCDADDEGEDDCMYEGKICGIVRCYGNKDFDVWETGDISEEDQKKIDEILAKYNTSGTSVRSAWDMSFKDVFSEEY